jgi:hypothetical protein
MLNIGHSSRLGYDEQTYQDNLLDSVSPLNYRLNSNYDYNCQQCLSTLGPRSSAMGQGVSTWQGKGQLIAPSQKLVDIESILSNRNVRLSKSRDNEINKINVTKFKTQNLPECNRFLDPISSRLSLPASNYRDMAINRFYNLPQNPQKVIFWNFAVNSSLEEKDNHIEELLTPINYSTFLIAKNNMQKKNSCDT